jgi:hypothetical protein
MRCPNKMLKQVVEIETRGVVPRSATAGILATAPRQSEFPVYNFLYQTQTLYNCDRHLSIKSHPSRKSADW